MGQGCSIEPVRQVYNVHRILPLTVEDRQNCHRVITAIPPNL